jgi:hypothetical protein
MDALEAEYNTCGKPLMGYVVQSPLHLTGCAIYNKEYINFSPHPLLVEATPWDTADVQAIVPHVHHTKLYWHVWAYRSPHTDKGKHDAFGTHYDTVEELEKLMPPEAVVMHRNKDGSLIHVLRERLHSVSTPVDVPKAEEVEPVKAEVVQERSGTGILYRSYMRDTEFLKYSLKSVQKFSKGFKEVIVVVPSSEMVVMKKTVEGFRARLMGCEEHPNGYLHQQVTKMQADLLMPSVENVLHMDSDLMMYREFTPESMIHEGKPEWLLEPYADLPPPPDVPWQNITHMALGQPVEFEFMRRHPFLIPAWVYPLARKHLESAHGVKCDEYILSQPGRSFSEYNYLGAFCYYMGYRDKFHWLLPKDAGPEWVRAFWSWGGVTKEVRQRMTEILK